MLISFNTVEMESFRGKAIWTKSDPNQSKLLMNGEGKIIFRNGSTYIGRIKDGLMDTQGTEPATFTTKGED